MTLAIETTNLTKKYKDVVAVEGLSLRVKRGEIYAFLGLNGAGKTTTIRMLLGMINPTAGQARVLDVPVSMGAIQPWASVGYLVETPYSYPELTVRENLDAVRLLRPGTPKQAVNDIIQSLSLKEYADRKAGTLSLGNGQRLGLAKALIHKPELLILDEPANGLDPAGIVEIRNLLLSLAREQGMTVFLSSHILGEVSRIADRIAIIHQGRMLQELDAAELEQQRRRRLVVQTRNNPAALAQLVAAQLTPTLSADDTLVLHDARAIEAPEEIATQLVQAGNPPTLLKVEQEDLEHYFLRLVGMEETA